MKLLFIQKDPFVNLGLMYISAYLKINNHETDLIIDSVCKNIINKIKRINPDIIAFSCTTGIHTWAIDLSKKIKQVTNIPIIMGGSHPTFFPEVINNPYIDMICIGEGELAINEFMDNMKSKSTQIKNFHIKKNNKIYKNDLTNLIGDLDKLPFPDRKLYHRYKFIMNQDNLRIITGRGCPYSCTFCFNQSLRKLYAGKGQYVRRRSIGNVIEELKEGKTGGIKRIDFQDDTFIIDFDTWLKPFLIEYKKEINLPFSCTARANLVNETVVLALKNAGCHSVKMGVESADEILNNEVLKKNLTRTQIADAVSIFKKHKIQIETFNLIGIPGEKIEQAILTMKFNARMGVDYARCALLQPYPKTEIEAYAKKQGYLDINFNLDAFENSYFMDTPIKLENKNQFINLQRLFSLGVRFKFFIPVIKQLIKLPPNFIFDTMFKIDYALSIMRIDKISIKDLITFGIRSKGFFSKGAAKK